MACSKGSRLAMMLVASVLLSQPAQAAETVAVRSITVNGMAKRQVVPDEAHLSVNLNSMEGKLAEAKTAHDQKLKKLMGLVKDAGIDEKKVRTQSSTTQPVYEYREVDAKAMKDTCVSTANGTPCPPPSRGTKSIRVLMGYRAQTTLDITVGDTSKLAGLMDAVNAASFEKGANQEWGDLTSVYYSLSNPDKIRDEMLAEALTNARNKAAMMAKAAGSSISRVYQIQESGTPSFDVPRPMLRGMAAPGAMMMKEEPGMAPPAGEQEVSANVTVMYELKE